MYQHIVVVGNVGRDPELRYTPDGTPVASFSVATNRRWTGRDGSQQEKTTWFRVSVFGRQAEVVNQYVSKGRLVLVEGEMDASAWVAQDGTARASLELRARNVRFLGGGRDESSEVWPEWSAGDRQQQTTVRSGKGTPGEPYGEDDDLFKEPNDEDDIPF